MRQLRRAGAGAADAVKSSAPPAVNPSRPSSPPNPHTNPPKGTGCIFHYDEDFPEGSGKGFKEGDKPNFTGSYYSYTKVWGALGGWGAWDFRGAAAGARDVGAWTARAQLNRLLLQLHQDGGGA
jgi:hypothetical protein